MKNQYFSYGTNSEQKLYDDLVRESIEIFGINCYYIPRKLVSYDKLFGEDVNSQFNESYLIELYLESYQNFEGQGDLFTKFGVQINDQATFTVSRTTWENIVSSSENLITNKRPNEGDLIYYPLGNNFFQINFVEHESPFWQVGEVQMYKMRCELFTYSQEKMDDNTQELVDLEQTYSYALNLELENVVGDFIKEELVVSNNLNAIVKDFQGTTLTVISRNENPVVGASIEGVDSGATAEISSFNTMEEQNMPYDSDNRLFETETREIWEFEEDNLFGEFQLDDSF